MSATRGHGMSKWGGSVMLLAWGAAACSSVFSTDDDCKVSRTCAPAEAEAGAGGATDAGGTGSTESTEAGAAGAAGAGGSGGTTLEQVCTANEECDDGDDENGAERCGADGACRAGDPPPIVESAMPEDGETGVAPDATIELTFSEELAGDTVTASTVQLLRGGAPVEAEVTYAAGNKVTITPAQRLALLGEYEVVVSVDVTDLGGGGLLEEWRSSFQVSEGAWKTPTVLASGSPATGLADHIALDHAGNAIVAWEGPSWRFFRLGVAQGEVKQAQPSGGNVLFTSLPEGPALIAWQSYSRSGYVAWNVTTNTSDGLQLDFASAHQARLHISPAGLTTLFKRDGGTTAFVRTDAGWSSSGQVLTATEETLSTPEVAFDDQDNGVAIWRAKKSATLQSIVVSTFSPQTQSWSPAAELPDGQTEGPTLGGRGGAPTAASSPDGVTVALWTDQPGGSGPCVLWSKTLSSIRAAVPLTDPTDVAVSCDDDPPAIVYDGETFVSAFTAAEGSDAAAATYTMRWNMETQQWGAFEKRQAGGEPAATPRMPRLATDGAGGLFLLWTTGAGTYTLRYQRWASGGWGPSASVPGGSFEHVLFVERGPGDQDLQRVPLAMNRAGMVAIAWEQRTDTEDNKLSFVSLQ